MDDASNTTGLATTDDRPLPVDQIQQIDSDRLIEAETLLRDALRYYHANCMYIPEDYERPLFPLAEIEEFLGVTWNGGRRNK